jgi:PadR family transcriptional regulator, regulatory protein PadR
MPKTNSDQLHGTLDMLVLKVLENGAMHGYAIATRLQQVSKDVLQVEEGSLYPALYRMEQRGWLSSEWASSDTGRRARFYRLTRSGRGQLRAETESWVRLSQAVQAVLTS